MDICQIGAIGFRWNLNQPRTVPFITSLYEIDQLLEDQRVKETKLTDLTDDQLLDQKLPARYHGFRDVFSRSASDTLPPHRPYDHAIDLERQKEADLTYSPLQMQTADELLVTKQYIIDHLRKGFIEPSQAPFAALVLFV